MIYESIKLGVRHLDCACDYGNEVEVGQGIARAISEGICTREDLWVEINKYSFAKAMFYLVYRSLRNCGIPTMRRSMFVWRARKA